MKRVCSLWVLLFWGVFSLSSAAVAKDLVHRLGVGFKNNSAESIPSLAAVYGWSQDYSVTGSFGLDTKKNDTRMQASAGLRKMIYFEPNLNFYMGGQAGLLSYEIPVDGKVTGFEILAVMGAEFFFGGLENLGFTVEGGVGLSSVKDTRVRTVADDPLRAGIIFYF